EQGPGDVQHRRQGAARPRELLQRRPALRANGAGRGPRRAGHQRPHDGDRAHRRGPDPQGGGAEVKFGLHSVNLFTCADPDAAARLGRAAEAAGFESLWTADHVVLPDPPVAGRPMAPDMRLLDPLIALTFLAAPTSRLKLATGVIILPPRPVQTPIPIVVGGRTPPAYRRAVAQGHGWYGFAMTPEQTRESVAGLRDAASKVKRPAGLGTLEISITPPGFDIPDAATIDAY